ncbi:hypothetical protein CY35_18G091500 [Sphagnum magellanicum]|nr:hypothetical protein CY35_18G091500 [Sphagnum magellanicum]
MADDKKRVREGDADGGEGMNVVVLTGDDNEEVAVAGVTLVSVSDEKTHAGDRDKIETKKARLQEAILVVQCSEEAVTALETEVVEDKTLTRREVLIDDHHSCFVEGPAAEDGEEAVQIVPPSQELSENDMDGQEDCEGKAVIKNDKKGMNVPGGRPGKKRKIAMLLAYCGAGYQGMQRNPGAITIEGELEQALFRAQAIAPCNFGDLRKVDWMRAARTDKGVSAVGQVISARLVIDPPGFVDRVNQHLPKQIRALGYKRVTSNFNAKQMCDRRRYEYLVPVYAFDPNAHHNRETVLAWTEKKEADRRERLEKRKATEKKTVEICHPAEFKQNTIESTQKDNLLVGSQVVASVSNTSVQFSMTEDLVDGVQEGKESTAQPAEAKAELESNKDAEAEVPPLQSNRVTDVEDDRNVLVSAVPVLDKTEASAESKFVFGEKEMEHLNTILGKYVGTHNFHNFTARIKAEDPSAKRYILSFEACEVIEVEGMQFVRCTVLGQSFMLHQIRKMIGMAIAIMRGCAPESIIDTALRRDTDVNVPMAPELGLFLDECFYTGYNKKFKNTHDEVSQKGFEKEIADFKREVIYSHIQLTEVKDGTMVMWLHSLNDRNYPDFVTAREAAPAKID